MGIKQGLYYWVKKCTPGLRQEDYCRLWGSHLFDGLDNFKGALCFISPTQHLTQQGAFVGRGHSTRGGFFLHVEAEGLRLPSDLPFLVTSNLETRLVFRGEVALHPAPILQQIINDQEIEEEYFVACDEWVGILRVPAPHQGLYGRLTAFSDRSSARIEGRPLVVSDHGDEPFGSVAIVSRPSSDE